jgi:hypothetical protein
VQRTELATGRIISTETIIVELIETDETPAVVIVRWPAKPSVFHPRRFGEVAALIARLFAEAATRLAAINRIASYEVRGGRCLTHRAAAL